MVFYTEVHAHLASLFSGKWIARMACVSTVTCSSTCQEAVNKVDGGMVWQGYRWDRCSIIGSSCRIAVDTAMTCFLVMGHRVALCVVKVAP